MCTLTYLPLENDSFILTSTRDIMRLRAEATKPKEYKRDGLKLYYAKDGKAGGTWLGMSGHKRLICLMNGAFDFYFPEPPYKKSRGLVLLDVLSIKDNLIKLNDFEGIEPFTMIIIEWSSGLELFELRWDGINKHFKKLENKAQLWSSSSLYNETVKNKRQDLFNSWLKNNSEYNEHEIMKFHHLETDDPKNGIRMKRDLFCSVSLSCVKKINNNISWTYKDLISDKEYVENLKL